MYNYKTNLLASVVLLTFSASSSAQNQLDAVDFAPELYPYIGINWLDTIYKQFNIDIEYTELVNFIKPLDTRIAQYEINAQMRLTIDTAGHISSKIYTKFKNTDYSANRKSDEKSCTETHKASFTCADSLPLRLDDSTWYEKRYSYRNMSYLPCFAQGIQPPFYSLALAAANKKNLQYKYGIFSGEGITNTHPYCTPNVIDWYNKANTITTITLDLDELGRPKEQKIYADANESNLLKASILYTYGEDIDTQRYYYNFDFHSLTKGPFALNPFNLSVFDFQEEKGLVLLMTAIYKKGQLLSLHHNYLEKQAEGAQFAGNFAPKTEDLTYKINYLPSGEIKEILAPTLRLDKRMSAETCLINWQYSKLDSLGNWQQADLKFYFDYWAQPSKSRIARAIWQQACLKLDFNYLGQNASSVITRKIWYHIAD